MNEAWKYADFCYHNWTPTFENEEFTDSFQWNPSAVDTVDKVSPCVYLGWKSLFAVAEKSPHLLMAVESQWHQSL